MSSVLRDPEGCKVAAVIGKTVKIYGPAHGEFRAFISSREFNNYGQAREYAIDFDYAQRSAAPKTKKPEKV